MTVIYLDTSALLKRYRTEVGSEIIADLFDAKVENEILTTSYYTVLEGASVARRLLKGRLLRRRGYMALMARFLHDAGYELVLQSVNDDVIARATQIIEQLALRPGDAVQLATALMVKESVPSERTILLASDTELCVASAEAGVETVDLTHPNAASSLQMIRTPS